MKISASQAAAPSPSNIATQIAALQKQLALLQKQLSSTLKEMPGPGEKELAEMQVKSLQLQITSIEAEISRLTQMAALPQLGDAASAMAGPQQKGQDRPAPPAERRKHGAGGNVDVYI
ncbi:FlxA-like family protein [Collimonas sp.]|jgi:hypothetical protein|uniref:FlxA-like family protein n=1 Tax=Collimonas sp. TaxID=1963772 RepID=UPI002BA21B0E|nr:FlxA-like family protein [Collimonas sp.]HWX01479.1 FlxA-like family protein [Collimonas sp.]